MTEAKLQSSCNAQLSKLGIKYIHIERGSRGGKTHRRGIPDLIFWYAGRTFAVELKVGKNNPSEEQIDWLDYLTTEGGACVEVCRSPEEFNNFLIKNVLVLKK